MLARPRNFYFNVCGKLSIIRCYTWLFWTGSNPAAINRFRSHTGKIFEACYCCAAYEYDKYCMYIRAQITETTTNLPTMVCINFHLQLTVTRYESLWRLWTRVKHGYTWILWQVKNCLQFRLIYWPVCSSSRREGDGVKEMDGIVILASCEFNFLREHEKDHLS